MKAVTDKTFLPWYLLLALMLLLLMLRGQLDWMFTYPDTMVLPVKTWLNIAMNWFVESFGWIFQGISWLLDKPMDGIQSLLNWIPWAVMIVLISGLALAVSGWRLALFSTLALFYMLFIGYWHESMNSLSLVAVSVPLSITIGFSLGVWGYFSPRAEQAINPMLDLLQTVPAFAYLIPIILLFGFGPVVGLIASVLYAIAPMVRNTILGLKRVPPEIIESGLMSGATSRQLFWLVRVPGAMKQMLLGMNQTTMAAFSMIIIASIIGASEDIGWEVIKSMRKARFGDSLMAGIVIALMAIMMDRITAAIANSERSASGSADQSYAEKHIWLLVLGAALVLLLLSFAIPALRDWPEGWLIDPAKGIDIWLEGFIVKWQWLLVKLKTWAFFYLMLPVKIGLEQTVSPYSWGFALTTAHRGGYVILALLGVALAFYKSGPKLAILVVFLCILFWFGITKLPWAVLIAMPTLLAWQLSGRALALGTALGFGFILVTGVWHEAMLSIYLCAIAVAISCLLGTTLGIIASETNWFSIALRPINDTLQTLPQFVILIPFVMLFKIGDFTALLAIVAYSIVPAIRYAEHGLRSISPSVLEVSASIGATRWQQLWQIKLPIALPVIMLGLNQTIMYGIAMLVIAALVGTSGLGQQVYIGLGDGDFGVGMIGGIGMAIIAIVADRLTQAWSKAHQAAYGLSEPD